MKLPDDFLFADYPGAEPGPVTLVKYEKRLVGAIVRYCAKICEDQAQAVCIGHDGPAPVKARMCATAILRAFGLEE